VTVRDLHLACSCTAGQFHRACAHAALVRSHLVAERFASSDYRLEQQEQALHTAARRLARQVAHSDPEHAPLLPVNAGRPISIFK
jgi:hypothetical protein